MIEVPSDSLAQERVFAGLGAVWGCKRLDWGLYGGCKRLDRGCMGGVNDWTGGAGGGK